MMRSLYSGISGLRNHQTRMDVIGNNIANVNTAGYKTSRVIFQDIFSQNMASGMGNQGTVGGTNPMQVGLGIRLSTVDVLHTRAAFQRTDKETDMMINGDGYFIVAQINPDTNMFEMLYTRAGNFDIDDEGYLRTSHGYYVLGYTSELVMGVVDAGQPYIPAMGEFELQAGDEIPFGTMIPSQSFTQGARIPAHLFGPGMPEANDGVGDYYIVGVTDPTETFPDTAMRTRLGNYTDAYGNTYMVPTGGAAIFYDDATFGDASLPLRIPATGAQPFRAPVFGLVVPTDPITGEPISNPETDANGLSRIRVTSDVFYDIPVWGDLNGGWDIKDQTVPPAAGSQQAALWEMLLTGNYRPVAEDGSFDPNFFNQFPMETVGLPGIGVKPSGDVSVILGNREVIIGKIAIAMFANPGGLEKAGNSLYRETASSGPVVITEAYLDGAGQIDAGGLEMSNVDLANEFTDMIVTQRGFQANSRIITVSDTMLEELVNLKR